MRAFEAGLVDSLWLAKCPLLEIVRRDPRGAKLQMRMDARASEVREVIEAAAREPSSRDLDLSNDAEKSRP